MSTRAPEICDKLRLLHRHASYAVARDKGVSVSHRSLAIDPHIKHEGQVYVEGTESDEISVIVDYWTSSKHLAKGVEISIVNQNEIIITVWNLLALRVNFRQMKLLRDVGTVCNLMLLSRYPHSHRLLSLISPIQISKWSNLCRLPLINSMFQPTLDPCLATLRPSTQTAGIFTHLKG